MSEEDLRDKRLTMMVAMIEQLGKDNGSGREYLTALTLCAGRYLHGMPDPSMRMQTTQQFLKAIRFFAEDKHDTN
jgi:hypothetical protein